MSHHTLYLLYKASALYDQEGDGFQCGNSQERIDQ